MISESENTPSINELDYKQAIEYAKELAQLYREEKQKRYELIEANLKLEKMNKELEELREQLQGQNEYLKEEVKGEFSDGEIICQSIVMKDVLHRISLVANLGVTILIEGETGTGKELVARAIHEQSHLSSRPFIKVNCASIPRELFESEFFGHVKGSFTGATRDRLGRFQLADNGSLFLDEVSEFPLEQQGKLLRVLQEGQFERVGEEVSRKVNVRVIAASNRDLRREVKEGRFREDLYFRLNVIPIHIPPLRERDSDIQILAAYFLNRISRRLKRPAPVLTPEVSAMLNEYGWPGNVRELENIIECGIIISEGGPLKIELLNKRDPVNDNGKNADSFLSENDLKNVERNSIIAALKKTNGKIYGPGGAGELLGIKPATLAYRIKKNGICIT